MMSAGTAFSLLGLLLAGWAPIVFFTLTNTSEPFPAAEANSLLWSALATARIFGFVLFGAGLCAFYALGLKSVEARTYALRSMGIVSGCGLFMAFLQAWTVINASAGWVLVALFAAVLTATVVAGRNLTGTSALNT